jgi:inorganic pyrophosphatase
VPHPTPRASDRTAVVVDLRSGAVDGFPVAGTLAPDGDPVDVASLARLRHVRATP